MSIKISYSMHSQKKAFKLSKHWKMFIDFEDFGSIKIFGVFEVLAHWLDGVADLGVIGELWIVFGWPEWFKGGNEFGGFGERSVVTSELVWLDFVDVPAGEVCEVLFVGSIVFTFLTVTGLVLVCCCNCGPVRYHNWWFYD